MNGLWHLGLRHLAAHRGVAVVLVACLALPLWLPLATTLLGQDYRERLTARAASTPMLAGARGNRFDLTLAALYFRPARLDPVPHGLVDTLGADGAGTAIPLHLGFTARGRPLVGTSPEYFERRGLRPAAGTLPLVLGDCTLGSAVAADLDLGVDDRLFTDREDAYDIARPPALRMRVAGVLAPTGGPNDLAVFVDVKTAWVVEGLAHGHEEPDEDLDERLVLQRDDERVVLNAAVLQYHEITEENIDAFHLHGDPAEMPVHAVLFHPASEKAGTLARANIDHRTAYRMLVPGEVVDDLLAFVFRIKALLDGLALIIGGTTLLLVALIVALSTRLRAAEMATLNRIGAGRGVVWRLHAIELGLLAGAAVVLAIGGALAARALLPDLVHAL